MDRAIALTDVGRRGCACEVSGGEDSNGNGLKSDRCRLLEAR